MNRWQRAALGVWVFIVLAGVGRAALYDFERHRGCYDIYPEAGQRWRNGEPLFDSGSLNSLGVFRYHPLVAVGCVPLTVMSGPVGSAVLRIVNFAALFAGLFWWGPQVLRGSGPTRYAQWFLLIAVLGGSPLFDIQLNIFTTGLLLITMAAVNDERWDIAAVALGLAVCCKAYPLSLALLLGMLYPRRFAPRMAAALVLLSLLPFACQAPDYVARQYRDWIHAGLNQRYFDGCFQDAMFLWQRWATPMKRGDFTLISIAAGAAVALVTWLRRRAAPDVLRESVFGMCCAWMMAFGPSTEGTTYVLLAPVAALAVLRMGAGMPMGSRGATLIAFSLLALAQVQMIFPLNRPIHRIGGQPFAAVLLLLVFAAWGRRQHKTAIVSADPLPRELAA